MKKTYKMSLVLLLLLAISLSMNTSVFAAKVVELMPSTADTVQDRIAFQRARYQSSSKGDRSSGNRETYSDTTLWTVKLLPTLELHTYTQRTHRVWESSPL